MCDHRKTVAVSIGLKCKLCGMVRMDTKSFPGGQWVSVRTTECPHPHGDILWENGHPVMCVLCDKTFSLYEDRVAGFLAILTGRKMRREAKPMTEDEKRATLECNLTQMGVG